MKRFAAYIGLIVGLLYLSIVSYGQKFNGGSDITISTPVVGDQYISGGTVTINAPVYGDLVATGGNITVNDSVMGDIIIAGGTIRINGYVGDDIRCIGGELYINNGVGGDIVGAGGKMQITRNAIIFGGLLVGGGDLKLDGTVNENVRIGSGNYTQNGIVKGNLVYKGGTAKINGTINGTSELAANQLIIEPNAAFYNQVKYWSDKKDVNFRSAVKAGGAVYDPSLKLESGRWHYLGFATMLGLLWYLGTALLFIVLLQYLFHDWFMRAADTVYNKTWKSLGYGLLFWISVPVGIVLLTITIIGIPLAVLSLFAYFVLIILSTVITSLLITHWLNNWKAQARWRSMRIVLTSICIFMLLKILSMIPVMGWFVLFLVVSMAFGALSINVSIRRQTV